MDMKKIGKFIQTSRLNLNLSEKQFADYLVASEEEVLQWEKGEVCPDDDTLRSMAMLFFCDVPEILNGGLSEGEADDESVYSADVAVAFDMSATDRVSPMLFGDNLEHTRGGINGGLAAQMLQNRKFVGKPSRFGYAHGWYPIGETAHFFFSQQPYTRHVAGNKMNRAHECNAQAITNYKTGRVGLGQRDLTVKAGKEYDFLTVIRAFSDDVKITVRLLSADKTVQDEKILVASTGDYAEKTCTLKATADDTDARLEVTFEDVTTVWIGTLSLMPKENFRGMRVDVIEKMKELGIRLLRWPGGNFAGEYSWKDGLLPREQRAPLQSYQWIETQPHTWGYDFHEINVDDFIALCREIGAKPFVTINPTWDTPEESAQWVEYCNGDETTEYGKLRIERGFKEPYNITLWSLGNEFGYGHMEGANTPEAYANLVSKHAEKMLAVSPEIVFCSSGPYPHDRWAKGSAKALSKIAPLVSLHHYAHYPEFVDPAKRKEEYYSLVSEVSRCFRARLRLLYEQIADDENLKISFDEWNAWYSWYRRGSVAEGIMAASVLHMFMQNAERYRLAQVCHFESVNEGALRVLADHTELSPTGRAISLMSRHADGIVRAASEDVMATEKNGVISCTLINRSFDAEKTFAIQNIGEVRKAVLYSSEDIVPNSEFEEGALELKAENGELKAVLPAHSMALIEFAI